MPGTGVRARGCAKTRAFNLRVESSSQFGQSENEKYWRRLSEEGNRENGSTLPWRAHVFTRAGPKPVTPRCLPEYLRRVGRGKGTFRAAARANLTRRSTDDGRPKVAPSSYRFSTPMPLSAFVSTVTRYPCEAGSPERFRSRRMQSASCGAGVRAARGNRS